MWGYFWCQLGACHTNGAEVKADAHHIVPVEAGGTDDDSNFILLCHDCHKLVHRLFRSVRANGRVYYAGPASVADLVAAVRRAGL